MNTGARLILNLRQKWQLLITAVMCRFSFHDWEIYKWSKFKDNKCKVLFEQGFSRRCSVCDKEQTLKRPKKYHPSKYVWSE